MCDSVSVNDFFFSEEEKEIELSEEDPDCLCGPRFCRSSVDSDENLSLDSVDDDEVVNVSLWESIFRKTEEKNVPYKEWLEEKNAAELTVPRHDGPAEFLDKEIFPLLLPAMKKMLEQARKWDALEIQKCRFNGIDFLAEVLWNSNPRHPGRAERWMDVFSIPPFRLFLRLNPRPIYPKSWLWTRDEGALIIQKWVRGWLVRKREDVQEMRLFWKVQYPFLVYT
ncbi:IQ domain-containing protein K-like [Athalia rosae]|uniref:IQ domain-containing protein K-like n=1 Tax=Athalia rosae TaxID=37344 RepID=UPI0020344E41|nr:IQ domain-containing protein K-like [Athalia rosae]